MSANNTYGNKTPGPANQAGQKPVGSGVSPQGLTSKQAIIARAQRVLRERIQAFKGDRVAFGLDEQDVVIAHEWANGFEFVLKTGLVIIIRKNGDYLFDAYLALTTVEVDIVGNEVSE